MEEWAQGAMQGSTADETAMLNSSALARVNLLQQIMAMDAEQINSVLSNDNEEDRAMDLANRSKTQQKLEGE